MIKPKPSILFAIGFAFIFLGLFPLIQGFESLEEEILNMDNLFYSDVSFATETIGNILFGLVFVSCGILVNYLKFFRQDSFANFMRRNYLLGIMIGGLLIYLVYKIFGNLFSEIISNLIMFLFFSTYLFSTRTNKNKENEK